MRISECSSDVCSSGLLVANVAISVLDGAGQNRLVERILDRRRGQGVIWTLQRPEMAALFDSILVMRDGRLVEQGSYDELTGRDSAFKGLVAARSEEHTSELQSLMRISYAVFCLKKKKHINVTRHEHQH